MENFEEYKDYLNKLKFENLYEISGVSMKDVDFLVKKYCDKY